jgi:hypothetical protein
MQTPVEAKTTLVKLQIAMFERLLLDRNPDFDPIPEEMLATMNLIELERVHKAYHELAYTPPTK